MYVRVFIFALKPPYSHSGRWSSVCGLFLRFIFSASNGDSLTSICTVSSIVSYWSYHLLVGIAFFAFCPFWMSFGLDYGGVPHTAGPIIKLVFFVDVLTHVGSFGIVVRAVVDGFLLLRIVVYVLLAFFFEMQ